MSATKERKGSQIDKFKDLARKLGTHDEQERFDEALRRVSKGKIDLSKAPPKSRGRKPDDK